MRGQDPTPACDPLKFSKHCRRTRGSTGVEIGDSLGSGTARVVRS
jgi:hypothetical protein